MTTSNDDLKVNNELTETTTIDLIAGYFRKYGIFEYNVRIDDFIKIVSNYIVEIHFKFGKNNKLIEGFDESIITKVSIINKNCFTAVSNWSRKLLSI